MTLRYTTVNEFWRRYGLLNSTTDYQAGDTPARETVASETVTAGTYYLDHKGVDEDSLVLYVGNTSTALTLTTHYTFDSDTSAVTITSAGATALSGEDLTAVYDYCVLENYLTYSDTTDALEAAESEFEDDTGQRFSTTASPQYKQIINESLLFHKRFFRVTKGLPFRFNPTVALETTVDGDYTTGSATLDVVDASKFPLSGTIYIGGNKVSYTSKSSNTLTVPTSTPSISDGATVRGEVIEISLSSEGSAPDWQVLTFNEDYEVFSDDGYVELYTSAYWNQTTISEMSMFPDNIRVRASYMQAWHEPGQDPIIPDRAVRSMYAIAARDIANQTVRKSHIGQRDNFNPAALRVGEDRIDAAKERYKSQLIHIK